MAQSRKRVFLALGSNIGDRLGNIIRAIDGLSSVGEVVKVSTVYESEPWGVEKQPLFLNCVLEFFTALKPLELLTEIKRLERKLGRKERFRWGPREIDIDILLWEDLILEEEALKIPHPRIEERDFFLVPLLELDRSLRNPITRAPLGEALRGLEVKLRPFCSLLSERLPST